MRTLAHHRYLRLVSRCERLCLPAPAVRPGRRSSSRSRRWQCAACWTCPCVPTARLLSRVSRMVKRSATFATSRWPSSARSAVWRYPSHTSPGFTVTHEHRHRGPSAHRHCFFALWNRARGGSSGVGLCTSHAALISRAPAGAASVTRLRCPAAELAVPRVHADGARRRHV